MAGLASENIDMAGVSAAHGPSGVAVIVTASSGNNIIAVSCGANAALKESPLEPPQLEGAAFVLLQLKNAPGNRRSHIDEAHKSNVRVMLDPATAVQRPPTF